MTAHHMYVVLFLICAAFAAPPADFNCKNKIFGWEYAKQLQPWKGEFNEVFEALQLGNECHVKPPQPAQRKFPVIPITTPDEATFFVDVNGDDSNLGTIAHPLRTVHMAVEKARAYANQHNRHNTHRTIVLREGTHFLGSTVHLGASDSYLTFQNYNGEEAIMSGGQPIMADWEQYNTKMTVNKNLNAVYGLQSGSPGVKVTKTKDAESCNSLCSANASCRVFTWHDKNQGPYAFDCYQRFTTNWTVRYEEGHTTGVKANIWKAHLPQFVSVPGLRINNHYVTRARYPNTNLEYDVPDNRIQGENHNAKWTPPKTYNNQIYINDDHTAALMRNDSYSFNTYRVGIHGHCDVYDPPVSYWCSNQTQGGGAFSYRIPSGVTPKAHVLPNSPYPTSSGETAVFNVWRPARWANWMFEIKKYDNTTNQFTFGKGGFQGARGNNVGGDWFIENVFEELDAPNEFFWDSTNKDLYVFYNGTGAPPDGRHGIPVVTPQLKVLVNHTGTQKNPVKNVKFTGLSFTATAYTYMDPHGIPSGGDWALERQGGIFLQGTENVVIELCSLWQMDGNGIMISGYNRYATVNMSDIAWTGDTAIAAWGITDDYKNPKQGVYGTDGNYPRYTQILGNTIHEVGLYEKQSTFFMQAKTAETTIRGNAMFNGARAGINFNDGFGGGDELSWNIIFNTCRESGDHGPFNSWDREPFVTDVRTGKPSIYMQWRHIHHNWLIANYESQEAVDNDDGSAYYKTHHNYMALSGNGMKNDFGGHDNHHYENIYAFVGRGFSICRQLPGHIDYFYNNTVIMESTGDYGNWDCKEDDAAPVLHDNKILTKSGTAKMCGKPLPEWVKEGHDRGTTEGVWPSTDEIIKMGKGLFGM